MLSKPPTVTLSPNPIDASGAETDSAPAGQEVATGWSPPIDGHGLFKSLMSRLPRRVRRSFDHEQLLALRQAAEEMAWGEHPLDIRLSLPLPGGCRYLVLVGGTERRHAQRRLGERRRYQLLKTGNLGSMLVLALIVAGLVTFLVLLTGALAPA